MLAVVYLIFNEGYAASSGDAAGPRRTCCTEAIRLGRLLAELMPDEPEVTGLLALMLLTRVAPGAAGRRRRRHSCCWPTRTAAGGIATLIAEGQALVRRCLRRNQPGPYQIQAAINAVHSDAPVAAATDWRQILRCTTSSSRVSPSPVVALNRAVALAEVEGPDAALAVLDELQLGGYYLFHAVRADLLRRLSRAADAVMAYDAAIARSTNTAERNFLQRARQGLALAD